VRKSEKVACAVPRLDPSAACWLAERHQRRLRWMDSQAVAGKPLGQYRHDPAGIRFPCAADHNIISETAQEASALQAWLYLVLEPCIEDLMEKDIGP
jgi:hypothetical protein